VFSELGLLFDGLDRSIGLLKASAAILRRHDGLLVYPLISSMAAMLVVASFALPLGGVHALGMLGRHGAPLTLAQFATAFFLYLALYFVIFFFNTALVGSVMMALDGKTPTLGDGLQIAAARAYSILGYAFIAATVGVVLLAIQRRFGFVGRFAAGLLGVGWTLATYLVVPVLAANKVGPIEAIAESAKLFQRTWSEGVIGQAGMGLAFTLIYLVEFACAALLITVACAMNSASLQLVMTMIAVIAFVLTALIHAALSGIYAAALYRYATNSAETPGFESRAMERAFLVGY
jgi:hypothetical protein